jgi:hypothetical protein
MQKRTESKKIGQIFENWVARACESAWCIGCGTSQRLEVVGGHDSSAVDGYATIVALSARDRALERARRAHSFEDEVTIVGMFSQNGFQTIRIGTPVDIVFDTPPGLKLPPN